MTENKVGIRRRPRGGCFLRRSTSVSGLVLLVDFDQPDEVFDVEVGEGQDAYVAT